WDSSNRSLRRCPVLVLLRCQRSVLNGRIFCATVRSTDLRPVFGSWQCIAVFDHCSFCSIARVREPPAPCRYSRYIVLPVRRYCFGFWRRCSNWKTERTVSVRQYVRPRSPPAPHQHCCQRDSITKLLVHWHWQGKFS